MNSMQFVEANTGLYRRQVQRILSSPEFVASRQVREFLQYVSEAAFEGRTHLEQVEIAEKVLQRGKNFNPLDDASVRKLGTALRQRLDRYYETDGVEDPVRVSLPVRSYIPVFEVRTAAPPAPPITKSTQPRRWILGAGIAAAASAAGWWYSKRPPSNGRSSFVIHTRQGDLMHKRNDVAPDALLLGPPVGAADEVTARMLFTPERATQQAGLLIYGDADRYVKLGRQFLSRPQLEFGMESDGRYGKPPGTFGYDPDAQNGDPVWLSIRRSGAEYSAFVSQDGLRWRPFGNVLSLPMPSPRVGVFAHNGRSDAPSTAVRFDRLSVGLSFHDLPPQPFDIARYPGWELTGNDPEPAARLDGECLAVDYPSTETPRSFDLVSTAPEGDWTVSTRMDFQSMSGSTAGITATGPKGRFRLIRWDLDGGSISAEHLGFRQVNRKDFEGAPPIVLTMTCRGGVIRSSFSRDDKHFEEVPLEVSVAALTDKRLSIGLHVSTSSWKIGDPRPSARFFYLRRELDSLTPTAVK